MAARRSDRAAEGASDRARRMGRGAPRRAGSRNCRRDSPRRAEGGREDRHPRRSRAIDDIDSDVRGRVRGDAVAPRRAARRRRSPKREGEAATRWPARMNMIQAINDAHRRDDGARPRHRRVRRGRRLFRRRVPRHRGPAGEVRQDPRVRHADHRRRHRRRRGRHGRLWPAARCRDPVRRLHLPRLRPDRQRRRRGCAIAPPAS